MENKNEIKCKFTYKCGICGKEYDSVTARANCELACAAKQEAEERRAAEAKKKAAQTEAAAEVTKAIDAAYDLLVKYTEEYGTYTYNGKINSLNNIVNRVDISDLFPSRFMRFLL